MTRPQRIRGVVLAVVAVALSVTALSAATWLVLRSGSDSGSPRSPAAPAPSPPASSVDAVAALTIHLPGGDTEVRPWTVCGFGFSGCADGVPGPTESLPRWIDGDAATITFIPRHDAITATMVQSGDCPRSLRTAITPAVEPGTYAIAPTGPPGLWRVDVTATRASGEDANFSFAWQRSSASAAQEEIGTYLNVLNNHDGRLDSYGVEFGIQGLATTPKRVSATIRVTNERGQSAALAPLRSTEGCTYAGSLSLRGSKRSAMAAVSLGGDSFSYDITLRLDGVSYRGAAHWSMADGLDQDTAPITWKPELPAYTLTP